MKGCKPLINQEIKKVSKSFHVINGIRNKGYFTLGIYSGFRCSELLSLKTKEIYQYGLITETIIVNKNRSLLDSELQLYESLKKQIENGRTDKTIPQTR